MTTMFCAFLVFVVGCAQTGAESNEGTRFAFALSPNDIVYYHAELILNARQTTDVTITTSSSSETVTVPGNWSYFYDIDYSMRAITDIEDKGIYITADEPITAHVAPMSSDHHGNHMTDANLLRPTTESSLEYILAGYHDMSTSRPMSYYMVVATEDNTDVHVLYTDDIGVEDEHFILQRFDVFTKDTFHENQTEMDFTGTRVVANKPVFVKSGNGCANNYAQGGHTVSRHIAESMPPLSELGVDYTSFPPHFGGYGGYEVRVIAVEDSTSVTVPAFSTSLILNIGEYHVINTFDTRLAFKVACSKPCMVAQYVRGLREGGDADFHMGAFMAILISDERASSHLIFTVPRIIDLAISTKAAISININTFPVTGLYLNDTSLADLDWQPVEESEMWSATVEIKTGFYQLYSEVSAERFTAYLYVVYGGWYAVGLPVGFADAIVPTEPPTTITTPPTTTEQTTTTSPTTPPGGQPPQYRVVLFGNFTSETGEDFSTACAQALRENFQIKALTMVPGLNDMFGQNLCGYVGSGDVSIVSSSSMLVTSGNAGVTDVSYRLEAASHVTISNLTSCAGELSIYLQDFDNWGRPVIPPASGCPDAVFDPDFFFEGPSEDNWICLGQNVLTELVSELQVDAPLYSLSVYDNFTTRNDEELDPTCGYDYQQAWQTKASEMVITLNGEITADRLCSGGRDKFSVVISSASFLPEGSKGSLTSTFFTRLTYDHLSFDDVYSCTAEMFIFLADHTNWGSLPLLPQQPGCPELLFEPPQFYHNGESWQCL